MLKSVLEVTISHFNPSRNGNATAEEQKTPRANLRDSVAIQWQQTKGAQRTHI